MSYILEMMVRAPQFCGIIYKIYNPSLNIKTHQKDLPSGIITKYLTTTLKKCQGHEKDKKMQNCHRPVETKDT